LKPILGIFDFLGIIDVLYYTGVEPYKKHTGDAGYDLFVSEDVIIPPGKGYNVPVNTAITSRRMWLLLVGRSSTFHKRNLIVNQAIIDNGYTDLLHMFVYNMSKDYAELKAGDRVGQVIPFRLNKTVLVNGEIHKKDERGIEGYGSTGE